MTQILQTGPLSPDELLAFGGLARMLVRSDGQTTAEEATALERASAHLFHADRGRVFDLLRRAATELPSDEAVRRAATAVTRPEARTLMFQMLVDIASSDAVAQSERAILDWLRATWGLR